MQTTAMNDKPHECMGDEQGVSFALKVGSRTLNFKVYTHTHTHSM